MESDFIESQTKSVKKSDDVSYQYDHEFPGGNCLHPIKKDNGHYVSRVMIEHVRMWEFRK